MGRKELEDSNIEAQVERQLKVYYKQRLEKLEEEYAELLGDFLRLKAGTGEGHD